MIRHSGLRPGPHPALCATLSHWERGLLLLEVLGAADPLTEVRDEDVATMLEAVLIGVRD